MGSLLRAFVISQCNKIRIITLWRCASLGGWRSEGWSIHSINAPTSLEESERRGCCSSRASVLSSPSNQRLAVTYSDWRASIRHFKTRCNWRLSADCPWIRGAQIKAFSARLWLSCSRGGAKVAGALMLFYTPSARRSLRQATPLRGPI